MKSLRFLVQSTSQPTFARSYLVPLLFLAVVPVAARTEEKSERWEYGEIRLRSAELTTYRTVGWRGPDGTRHQAAADKGGKAFEELAEKMGIKAKIADSTDLLNALSREGWEVATHSVAYGANVWIEVWTVRRKTK